VWPSNKNKVLFRDHGRGVVKIRKISTKENIELQERQGEKDPASAVPIGEGRISVFL
jgi:hypothetical protein